jgi:4'-phosphopantetheinyl transferase EntD
VTTLDDAIATLAARAGVAGGSVAVTGTGRDAERAAGAMAAERAGAAVVGHHDDGRPRFADGATGSIAHTGEHAVAAAVTVGGAIAAVGIDIETSAALQPADAALVLDAREQAAVAASSDPAWTATVLWSVKESVFKAWSTASDGGLGTVDPVDIHVDLDVDARTCTAVAHGDLGAIVARWDAAGAYVEADGAVITVVTLRARASG